jgi:hypothetical protein
MSAVIDAWQRAWFVMSWVQVHLILQFDALPDQGRLTIRSASGSPPGSVYIRLPGAGHQQDDLGLGWISDLLSEFLKHTSIALELHKEMVTLLCHLEVVLPSFLLAPRQIHLILVFVAPRWIDPLSLSLSYVNVVVGNEV